MQNRYSADGTPIARSANMIWLTLSRHRRRIMSLLIIIVVFAAGATGYILGNSQPAVAVVTAADSDRIADFANQLAAANELSAQVEQLNLQDQLEYERSKAAELEQTVDAQREEMDNLETTILNALMSNLVEQSVSRSRRTLSAFREEAVNLLSLSNKLRGFLKTETAAEIDLTAYEEEIARRLRFLPTIRPIPGTFNRNSYGYRIHPVFGFRHFHTGIDVGAPTGTRIKAAAAGYVTASTYGRGAGYFVTINHGNGFTTTYMHCSRLLVRVGQFVEKNEVIAHVGSTGTSTHPHLHYEIRFNGQHINPANMILE